MIPQFNPLSSFYPLSLFANGEPGFWLDPSDFSAMYQDAAGTTAVTAVEQPVGLILDKSQGLVLGAELVTTYVASGAFGNWNGMSLAGGVLTTSGAPVNGYSAQVPVTASAMYKVVLPSASVPVGGTWSYVVSWSANGVSYSGQVMTAAIGSLSFYFLAPATATKCEVTIQRTGASSGGATDTCTFNGFSVKKIAGTHYYQSTAGVRPVLSARYNQLVATENYANAAWVKFVSGSGSNPAITANYALAPNGTMTATRIQFNRGAGGSDTDYSLLYQKLTLSSGTFTRRIWLASNTGSNQNVLWYDGSAAIGQTVVVTPSGGWFPLSGGAATTTPQIVFGTRAGSGSFYNGGDQTLDILVWGADLRPSDQATGLIPTYQRVNTSTDYDTAGFPLYLSGNGTQWMQCAAQDYTGVNIVSTWSGLRKKSDATLSMLFELSTTGVGNGNPGSFRVSPPGANTTANYGLALQNSAATPGANSASSFAAPITNTLFASFNTQGLFLNTAFALNVNGASQSIGASGTLAGGNFGNYPGYLFCRGAGASFFFTGNLYQLIARGSTVASNAAQISAAESWTDLKTRAY